jgi:hypothetical protein
MSDLPATFVQTIDLDSGGELSNRYLVFDEATRSVLWEIRSYLLEIIDEADPLVNVEP